MSDVVWEQGGNLIDVSDFSKDSRVKYLLAYWKDLAWKKFTEEVKAETSAKNLANRKRRTLSALMRRGVYLMRAVSSGTIPSFQKARCRTRLSQSTQSLSPDRICPVANKFASGHTK